MSGRLPQLSYRKVAKALQRAGLVLDHATGSHHFFIHPLDPTIRATPRSKPNTRAVRKIAMTLMAGPEYKKAEAGPRPAPTR